MTDLPPVIPPPKRPTKKFWCLLVLPWVVSLLAYGLDVVGLDGASAALGLFVGTPVSVLCAVFCSRWLARLVPASPGVRILAGLAMGAALVLLNLFITCVGCVSSVGPNLH